jgi:protein-tyrosine phosphatase
MASSIQNLSDEDVLLFGAAESEHIKIERHNYCMYFMDDIEPEFKARIVNLGTLKNFFSCLFYIMF